MRQFVEQDIFSNLQAILNTANKTQRIPHKNTSTYFFRTAHAFESPSLTLYERREEFSFFAHPSPKNTYLKTTDSDSADSEGGLAGLGEEEKRRGGESERSVESSPLQ